MKISKTLVSAAFAGLLLSSCGGSEASKGPEGRNGEVQPLTGKIVIKL